MSVDVKLEGREDRDGNATVIKHKCNCTQRQSTDPMINMEMGVTLMHLNNDASCPDIPVWNCPACGNRRLAKPTGTLVDSLYRFTEIGDKEVINFLEMGSKMMALSLLPTGRR